MKSKTSKWTLSLLVAFGCGQALLASGCSDDPATPDDDKGGASTAGKASGGKGGKSSGGATSHAGTAQGGDSEGGEDAGGKGGTGGKAGAGGGGKGGTGGNAGSGGKAGAGGGGNGGTGGNGGSSGHSGSGGGGTSGNGGGGAGGTSGNGGGAAGGTSGNGGGGAGGTSGTGGTGGAVCGNGKVEGDELCDNSSGNNYLEPDCGDVWGTGNGITGAANACLEITSPECELCESTTDCVELTDPLATLMATTAVEGPAIGEKRFALYNETLDCVRDTNCAKNTALDCYCGTVSSAQCDAGNGNGLCKTVIERGLETTNPAEISTRFSNVTLGGGLALARVSCDVFACPEQCFED